MTRKSSFFANIPLILILLFVFFYIYVVHYDDYLILLMIGLVFLLILFRPDHKLFLRTTTFFWVGFALWLFVSIAYSVNQLNSLKSTIVLFGFIFISLVLSSFKHWQPLFFKLLCILSFVFSVSVIFNWALPTQMATIIEMFLSAEQIERYRVLISSNLFSGFAAETSYAAIYAVPLTAFSFSRLLTGSAKKPLYLVLLLVACGATFLTGKRAFLVAHAAAIVFIVVVYYLFRQKGVSKLLLILPPALLCVVLAILFIPTLQTTVIRLLFSSDGFMAGRDVIYRLVWERYMERPVLGYGLATTGPFLVASPATTVGTPHNIYLQLLVETGLIGLLLFLSAAATTIFSYIKALGAYIRNHTSDKTHIVYLLTSLYFQVIFLVYGLSGNPLFDYPIALLYFVSAAVGGSLPRYVRAESTTLKTGERSMLEEDGV